MSKEQTSISGGRFEALKRNSSVSSIEFGRPLMLPSEINRLPSEQEIILVNGMYPIRAQKIKYYLDRHYRDRLLVPPGVMSKPKLAPIKAMVPMVEAAQSIGSSL